MVSDLNTPKVHSAKLVIASVASLLLLAALDQTIVSTALPTIVADLGGLSQLSWVVTAYILASTVASPIYGKLGDLYGRRNIVYLSVTIFLLGSTLCGVAQTMPFLIFARAVQGIGGGGLFVLALAVVGDVIEPRDRGKVQGVFAAIFSISSVIGPLVGGIFVQSFSWHWIFFINVPIGVAALVAFAISFPGSTTRTKRKIDWLGAISLSFALSMLTLFASLGAHGGSWVSAWGALLLGMTVVSTAVFIWAEGRAQEPILPLSLFKLNVFWVCNVISFISGVCMLGAITYFPLYLQLAQGASPTMSGLQLIPLTIGIVTTSTLAGIYMGKTGRYTLLAKFGMVLLALGGIATTLLTKDTSVLRFSVTILLIGLGMGFIFPILSTAVQNAVPKSQLGTATAAPILFRQIGGSLAVSAFGAIFVSGMGTAMTSSGIDMGPISISELGPQSMAIIPQDMRGVVGDAVVFALHPSYWIITCLAIIGIGFAFKLHEIPLSNRKVAKSE